MERRERNPLIERLEALRDRGDDDISITKEESEFVKELVEFVKSGLETKEKKFKTVKLFELVQNFEKGYGDNIDTKRYFEAYDYQQLKNTIKLLEDFNEIASIIEYEVIVVGIYGKEVVVYQGEQHECECIRDKLENDLEDSDVYVNQVV